MENGPRSKPRTLGLTKVRSGCITCKTRRVKCGEEKPFCLRCINFGIDCAGYLTPKPPKPPKVNKTHSGGRPILRSLLPLPRIVEKIQLSPSKEIIPSLFETQQEHDYFETFCTKTIFDILPSFQSPSLKQTLLQACTDSLSIRNAVSALGALDKTSSSLRSLSALSLDSKNEIWPSRHHQNALKQYSKAVKHMRSEAFNGKSDLRTILLTCLVILCFEAWNGNHQLTVQQILLAFKLINTWKQQEPSETTSSLPRSYKMNSIETDLVLAFSRLDVQVVSLTGHPVKGFSSFSIIEETELLDKMPVEFESIEIAEIYEDALVRRAMRFLSSEVHLPETAPTTHGFPLNGWWGVRNPTVLASQQKNVQYYKRWFAAFDKLWNKMGLETFPDTWWKWRHAIQGEITPTSLGLLQSRPPNLSKQNENHDFEKGALYRIHLYTGWIGMATVCTSSEADFDIYTPHFLEVVELSEHLLQLEKNLQPQAHREENNHKNAPRFCFDTYVVIPLHLTGHKCRDPLIRRKIIWLMLQYPRREGVWDSVLIVKVIEWVMGIEEDNMVSGYVPEWARLHGIQVEMDMENKTAQLRCEQRLSEMSTETETKVKTIVW